MTRKIYTKGFTLVELLVVIAIVVILAGALFLIINPANLMMKARDSKRVSELTELNKAIALGVADSKITITTINPTLDSCGTPNFSVNGTTGWVRFTAVGTGLATYMGVLPRDPTNTGTNCYYYDADAATSTWELSTLLQSSDYTSMMANDGGDDPAQYEVGTDQGLDLI